MELYLGYRGLVDLAAPKNSIYSKRCGRKQSDILLGTIRTPMTRTSRASACCWFYGGAHTYINEQWRAAYLSAVAIAPSPHRPKPNTSMDSPKLRVAAAEFELAPELGTQTDNRTGAKACEIVGPLKTTIMLLDDHVVRVCLITTHFGPSIPVNVSQLFRQSIAKDLGLPISHVLILSSHNHCSVALARNGVLMYESYAQESPPAELLPIGEQFLTTLRGYAQRLSDRMQAVTVWWGEGRESRITYNRKGRRPDGTTYLMREEDRVLMDGDYSGDIDPTAPIVLFRNDQGCAVAALTLFTGHPVTSYHPERTIVFGEWPQVASDTLANRLQSDNQQQRERENLDSVPVGFMQGCAGNVNSKQMLSGDVACSTQFGRMLGCSYIDALENLKISARDGLELVVQQVGVPLAPLPSRHVLTEELNEIDNFIQRARAGDENTLSCVGLNFAATLSPGFRARMVELVRPWTKWALELYEAGAETSVDTELMMDVSVLRIGDVGIVAMPCEPFQEIGRRIRDRSPLAITIPCGYANVSHGYIPDSTNVGDGEYMSSHHRYTRFRPPLQPPAGDVLADAAVRILNQYANRSTGCHPVVRPT